MVRTRYGITSVKAKANDSPPIYVYFCFFLITFLLHIPPFLCLSPFTADVSPLFQSSTLPKHSTDRCTTIIVGKDATVDGSTMTTHTNDCGECDFRLAKVNPKTYPKDSKRPVYTFYSAYPKVVRNDNRSVTWLPENLDQNLDKNILEEWKSGSFHHINGYIDQSESTFGLVEGLYGIMNDQQVAIGESTCGAKFWTKPIYAGGQALFEIAELSQIALERCRTARCAIELIGELAETYGYYGASWNDNDVITNIIEAGEALTIADPQETWIFHITPDDTGISAVWCAQRVPDNHISAVANIFVIQEIDTKLKGKDFYYSKNIFDVAERNNLWSPKDGKLLNFRDVYGIKRDHIYYGTRRIWRVFTVLSKGTIQLDPIVHALGEIPDYPFSVPIDSDKKLSVHDLMDIQRDHFEGTAFDLTKGIAAGPYGDPNRWDPSELPPQDGNVTAVEAATGSFDRSIALFRASYVTVTTSRSSLPNEIGARVFIAQYMASMSSFLPIYVSMDNIPKEMMTGSLYRYTPESNWWNMASVGNWATRFYMYIRKDVEKVQRQVEDKMMNELNAIEDKYNKYNKKMNLDYSNNIEVSTPSVEDILSELSDFSTRHVSYVSERWLSLFHNLIAKYRDGYKVVSFTNPKFQQEYLFYPKSWLEASGFFERSETPTIKFVKNEKTDPTKSPRNSLQKEYGPKKKGLHRTITEINETDPEGAKNVEINSVIFTIIVGTLITFVVGYLCFQWGYRLGKQASGFTPL